MKRFLLWTGVALGVVAVGFAYANLRTDTYLGRWFAWRASDVDDMRRFPALAVAASGEHRPFRFHVPSPPLTSMTIEGSTGVGDGETTLEGG